ncbi:uncharacterized protein LOC109433293 [Aedes albopictus]|uniref:SAM domain-containing protein n=1 Tax=Aedes albopictus TaxID=7160 RepID=A0ABM1YK81_AEDAL
MFTKQQIIAALLEMQPGEMPAAVDPIASSEEIVHSISGAAAGCQATHIFSSPVIIEQASKHANKTIEEKSGLEEPEVRYVLVEEAAPRQKAMEGDLGEFLRSHDLEAYTNVLENDHGITDVQTFTEMEKEDINLFCQVISHRIRFRKLLAELKGNSVNVSKQGSSSLLNDAGPPKVCLGFYYKKLGKSAMILV